MLLLLLLFHGCTLPHLAPFSITRILLLPNLLVQPRQIPRDREKGRMPQFRPANSVPCRSRRFTSEVENEKKKNKHLQVACNASIGLAALAAAHCSSLTLNNPSSWRTCVGNVFCVSPNSGVGDGKVGGGAGTRIRAIARGSCHAPPSPDEHEHTDRFQRSDSGMGKKCCRSDQIRRIV